MHWLDLTLEELNDAMDHWSNIADEPLTKHIKENSIEYTFSTKLENYIIVYKPYLDGYRMDFYVDDELYDDSRITNHKLKNYWETNKVFSTLIESIINFIEKNNIVKEDETYNLYLKFKPNRMKLKTIVENVLKFSLASYYKQFIIDYIVYDNYIILKLIKFIQKDDILNEEELLKIIDEYEKNQKLQAIY